MNRLENPFLSSLPRRLEGMEKLYYLADRNHPNHFVIATQVTGRTSVDDWSRALNAAAASSALVWCHIEADGAGDAYFYPHEAQRVPMKVVSHDHAAWTQEVALQMAEPFDTASPPLLRATLLHSPDRATLILCAHHTVGDGLSLTRFHLDVIRMVAGLMPVRSTTTMAASALARALVGALPDDTLLPERDAADMRAAKLYRKFDGTAPTVRELKLSRMLTQDLQERVRIERTTVHAALAAAASIAVAKLVPGIVAPRIITPVDIRDRLLEGTDHLSICITGTVLQGAGKSRRLWEQAREMSTALEPLRSRDYVAAVVIAGSAFLDTLQTVADAAGLLASVSGGEVLLTNLGKVEAPRDFGALTLDAVWGPSAVLGFVGEQTLGVGTFHGHLHMLHSSYDPYSGLLPMIETELQYALL